MISASALHRIEACPASEAIPHTKQENEWQGRGTAIHRYVELLMQAPSGVAIDVALKSTPEEYREECEQISTLAFTGFFGEAPRHEVAFALDVESGEARELGEHLDRKYPKVNDTTIVGTADMVLVDYEHSRVMVSDMKTGRAWIPHPRENTQLGFFAVALARVYGAKSARVAIHKLNDDGTWYEMVHDYDEIDLDGTFARLRDIVFRVGEASLVDEESRRFDLGDHCTFCPARLNCPAQASVMQQMIPLQERALAMDDDVAWDLHEWLPRARKIVEAADKALKDYVLHSPGAKRGGKELRIVTTDQEKVVTKVALQVLSDWHGPDALMAAVTTSKKKLEAAVPDSAGRGSKKALIDAIRVAGGFQTTRRDTLKAVAVEE